MAFVTASLLHMLGASGRPAALLAVLKIGCGSNAIILAVVV